MSYETMRWRDYLLCGGADFGPFWSQFLTERERNVLLILGLGFDSRMCDGIKAILGVGGTGARDVVLLTFDEGPNSPSQSYTAQRDLNGIALQDQLRGRGKITKRNIQMFSSDSRRIGSRSVIDAFPSSAEFHPYSDIVVDISALPRGLYFPLLAKLLTLLDQEEPGNPARNLHVIVSHSAVMDRAIQEEGLDEDATFLHGFAAAAFERDATSDQPRIWIPALGGGQHAQLDRIHTLVSPDEICPLLPSPSWNPREGDDLMLEYRELLFDRLRVEPRNIIFAAEENPYEVYRQIMRSIFHYRSALGPLGGCKVALSAMSSKLASIGVFLAAYELNALDAAVVCVAHVETQGYVLSPVLSTASATLHSLWISGECYGTK